MRPPAMLCKPSRFATACLALIASFVGLSGCKRHAPVEEAAPSATESAAPAPAPPRCKEVEPRALFTLGERSNAKREPASDEDDAGTDDPQLPFAVEIGGAVATSDGFVVSALATQKGKTEAQVALVDASVERGRVASLGTLHGDVDPPELATDGTRVVALVHDTDAGGERLRLAAIRPGPKKLDVVLGAEIAESRDESRIAHVALGKERGVAVWDAWDKTEKHGYVRAATFAKDDVSNVTRPRTLSLGSDDAEGPNIVARPGGFWAAWISRPLPEKKKLTMPKPAPSAAPAGSAGTDEPNLVDLGKRGISVVPLDENGVPTVEPKNVAGDAPRVLVFDLTLALDGALLLAFRDDDAAPGFEQRNVHVLRVAPDGSVERQTIEDEQNSIGVPALLSDSAPPKDATARVWLSLDSVSDETRFAALGPNGRLLDALATDPLVRGADTLALARGRFLLARPDGMAMQLFVAECRPGAAVTAAKDSPQ
jgi:hypothetical protein